MATGPVLCPSSRCEPGAVLLGIVMGDGRIAYASDRIEIDEAFVAAAQEGRPPEQRFRFSGPCVQGACRQWTGSRCGVIDGVVDHLASAGVLLGAELPACSIRGDCRWYAQVGPEACRACPVVVTDGRSLKEEVSEVGREPDSGFPHRENGSGG